MEKDLVYTIENRDKHLSLSEQQKNAVQNITLGIEEVDPVIRELAVDDAIKTLENGHPLNRIITGKEGGVSGYIACEDFIPHEAYIKYFGTNKSAGKNLLSEVPAFLEYAKAEGYTKLNFHGWNARLNRILERFGFERSRTDTMGGFGIDFYEKSLVEQKNPDEVEKGRITAFEQKYSTKLNQAYRATLNSFSKESRNEKEEKIESVFNTMSIRLESAPVEFNERQKMVLKLKLARYFQTSDSLDSNVLFDAIAESPNFINTEKGSLHRLFEVHQEKTLIKIAEIRKRNAEKAGGEFNPYEALFTTKSGKYYVARLLNMPHLEQESEYMDHCVGTSDSYINQMKRGEIEILSFRNTPTIDTKSNKLNDDDTPLITIEYNVKTKTIEQMKKQDDAYLKPDDPYYNEVIEALKQLRTTPTDTGELRDFSKISPSELENIDVSDECVLTERGEVSFRDFDPDAGIFVLKIGRMEITADTPKVDAVKKLKIVDGIECATEQIAYNPNEITENTKAYVGKLETGIFQKFSDNIKHVYTSFPERKIKIENLDDVESKTGEQWIAELEQSGIHISDYAKSMLKNPDFAQSKNTENSTLVRLTVADLGFTGNATTDQIYSFAEQFGLELCPAEIGPQYRLKYQNQPMSEWLRIAMKQINGSDGNPRVFYLGRYGGALWLDDYWAGPRYEWNPHSGFVFRLRKYKS